MQFSYVLSVYLLLFQIYFTVRQFALYFIISSCYSVVLICHMLPALCCFDCISVKISYFLSLHSDVGHITCISKDQRIK